MATRRVSLSACEIGFDHGAQYMSAKTPEFAAFLSGQPRAMADVEMTPGLTLMAAFPPEAPRPYLRSDDARLYLFGRRLVPWTEC